MIMCACFRWKSYYHMRVYFNFHCYIQNKPIAKMFIAIVNTCSLYSLLLFVALFPWWAPSRVKTPVPYKHKATGIDASTRTTIIVAVDTCFARIEWHCFRQCKKTQATITSSRVCSGVMKHCHDRGRDQGRSTPSAALHVVCTNRVALLQRLLCWPTVWRPHHVHVRRRADSCRTSMRRPSGWLWGLSSPFCAPRRSMVQTDASHQRTTSAAASLPYLTTRAQFRCKSEYRASTVLRTCARIPRSRALILALKK